MRPGIETRGEFFVQGDLHPPRGKPVEGERGEACEQPWIAGARDQKAHGRERFREHEWRDDPSDPCGVALMVGFEALPGCLCEEGVVHELDGPDQAHEGPCGGGMA